MGKVLDYLKEFLREQRGDPKMDLVRGLFAARYDGERPLTETELISICYVLFIGGLDTVYSTIGWIVRHLARDLALQQRLREQPALLPDAVEEFLRVYSAASSQRRVKSDLVFHGVEMRAGDAIQLSLPLAGRDPKAFPDPHTVQLERRPRHLAFGTGSHSCIGLHLGRREIRIVLEALLSRFEEIRLPAGGDYAYHTGSVFGVDRLPLEWSWRRAT